MSSSYLWDDHKEEIEALYEEGLSVPVIHKRIRSDVFKIRQVVLPKILVTLTDWSKRVLYDKLKEWGLPTDPATRRQRAARAKETRKQTQVYTPESRPLPFNDHILPAENGSLDFLHLDDSSFMPNAFNSLSNFEGHTGNLGSSNPFPDIIVDVDPSFATPLAGSCIPLTRPASSNLPPEYEVDNGQHQWFEAPQNHTRWSAENIQRESPFGKSSRRSRDLSHQSSSSSMRPASRGCKTKNITKALTASYNNFIGIDPRSSLVSTDSGYAGSSRSSLVTNPPRSTHNENTTTEFGSLYKVACSVTHESVRLYNPNFPPICKDCGFSTLHWLAWHANKLPAEEFKQRIKSFRSIKNICDRAGNTGLHYASAAGADFDHLAALIDFGVECNKTNTRGQTFLHLIEPNVLDFDLFNLLNIQSVRNLRGCRDQYGQTVLHELCRKADSKERQRAILRFFDTEGFPSGPLNCFGQTAKNVCLQDSSIEPITLPMSWESKQHQIDQDYEVFDQARSDPNFKHPETGSNIVHVLSRLHLKPKDRLDKLLKYICEGARLSDYNRDGELPLISFACQRPNDELKVNTELYIESLLNALPDRGSTEVHMRNRLGQTALYCACVDGSHFAVKLLIARGSNVNARTVRNESILRATLNAQARAVESNDQVKLDNFKEVIALLERSGAVEFPTSLEERGMQINANERISN